MTVIAMPKLSDSMEQGTIISWLKSTGDHVEAGDELCEIETDKATAAYVARVSGVLEILISEGSSVKVGEAIARIGSRTETPAGSAPAEMTQVAASVEARGAVAAADPRENGRAGHVRATPLARRTAAAHGIDLDTVRGTGPLGRITRGDVLGEAGVPARAEKTRERQAPPSTENDGAQAPVPADGQRRELSRLQQVIARRMAEAKATIPHFQVQTEAAVDAVIALRAQLKALADEGQAVPSINDVVIKAAATALRSHPLANASYRDRGFELHEAIHVGIAVAADEALVVPTVFDADTKSIGQIARDTRRLASSVRDGTISPRDLSGGTFTVSNLGMFGMTAITPVINPPQAAILGVGAARPVLARVDGEIIERNLITLTLSCDHRVLYGADAAQFLATIRRLLEEPLRLAL